MMVVDKYIIYFSRSVYYNVREFKNMFPLSTLIIDLRSLHKTIGKKQQLAYRIIYGYYFYRMRSLT